MICPRVRLLPTVQFGLAALVFGILNTASSEIPLELYALGIFFFQPVSASCVAASSQTQLQDAPLEALRVFREDQNHEHRHHKGHD